MTREDEGHQIFSQEDHQVAYILDGDDGRKDRPVKRRRVSKKETGSTDAAEDTSLFGPLLSDAEKPECVLLRQKLFEESWAMVDSRIQGILRDSNSAILDQVSTFVEEAKSESIDHIPAAFIITGPNIASQGLLFDQLSETLQASSTSKFVTLRSPEVATLKAVLKKVIRDVTARASADDQDDLQVGPDKDGRRYLDYDLEALQAFIKLNQCDHIFVAFQDSEGFDSSLLSDLIALFNSWRPRIPFTLLFGIATSVELLQARLLKSACRLIHGAQFDCVQTGAILETVFRSAVAASDVPLRLGPLLLRNMLDRQHDQIAGIQSFISSLKYAYMCHFYANPLSILLSPNIGEEGTLQEEHFEAMRNLTSYRAHVEEAVELMTPSSLQHAKSLIEDDEYLLVRVRVSGHERHKWIHEQLRALLVMEAVGAQVGTFSRAYVAGMSEIIPTSKSLRLVECIRKMGISELATTLGRIITIFKEGDESLGLGPTIDDEHTQLQASLEKQLKEVEELAAKTEAEGISVRSKYSGQSKVMRTTVIAQKVQLSRDSAALREEDNQLTEIVDEVTKLLSLHFRLTSPSAVFLSEGWLYDSRSPSRDVFVPRTRAVFERSLSRPHDYLACSCCRPGEDGVQATLPATSILYQMYQETGSLINVADLWSAFHTLVTEQGTEEDERKALVMFYRGLAELKAMGFVKGSKKKSDHIAKVKWL